MTDDLKALRELVFAMNGESAALKLAVIALMKTHPRRSIAMAEFHQSTEELASNTLASMFPDASCESLFQTRDLILRLATRD